MRRSLALHPDTLCKAATSIIVDARRDAHDALALRFTLTGDTSALRLPAPAPPARTDDLWRHTCFEAMVAAPSGYRELNLAPSGAWAAYSFEAYRQGMTPLDVAAPEITVSHAAGRLELTARLSLDAAVAALPVWRLGLSAVIEDTSGRITYWALAHPPGRPDFHHADCFALELPETPHS